MSGADMGDGDSHRARSKGRGRPQGRTVGTEPGLSYFNALRLWPERANISWADLAKQFSCSESRLSSLLRNTESQTASPTWWDWAKKIIKTCGGTKEDLDDWSEYHLKVIAYQGHGGPLPTPPIPKHRGIEDTIRPHKREATEERGPNETFVHEFPFGKQTLKIEFSAEWATISADDHSVPLARDEVIRLNDRADMARCAELVEKPDATVSDEFDVWRSRLPGGGKVLLDTTTVRNALMVLDKGRPTPLALLDLATLCTALVCYEHVIIQSADPTAQFVDSSTLQRLASLGAVHLDLPDHALQLRLSREIGSVLYRMRPAEDLRERLAQGWGQFLGWQAEQCHLDMEGWDRDQNSPPDWDGVPASHYMDDMIGIPDDTPKRLAFLRVQTLRTFANDAVAKNLGIPYLAAPFRAPVQAMIVRGKYEKQRVVEMLLQEIDPRPVEAPRVTDEPYFKEFSAPFILGLVLENMKDRDDYWRVIADCRERFRGLREHLERDRAAWNGNIMTYARNLTELAQRRFSDFLTQVNIAGYSTTVAVTAVGHDALPVKLASLSQPPANVRHLVHERFQPQLHFINNLRDEVRCLKAADYQVERVWRYHWEDREYGQLEQLRASNPLPLLRMRELG